MFTHSKARRSATLRRWAGINLIRYRRAIGLLAFLYAALHLLVWVLLDLQLRWSEIGADLVKRPYIIIGFAAFLALVPLAITSNNVAIRRMGAASWKRLHRLAYPATVAGAVHFVMIGKVYTLQSSLYLAAVVALLAIRWWKMRPKPLGIGQMVPRRR